MFEARILGCGSSGGVPRLGGPDGEGFWGACDPANPKNRRTRCSLLLSRFSGDGQTRVLVDTSPDMRQQLLDARVSHLDGVLISHGHADQLHGMDDLRVLVLHNRRKIDVWTDRLTMKDVMQKFGYCFVQPEGSDYPPILISHALAEPFAPLAISGPGGDLPVRAFGQGHGRIRSLGFRFGGLDSGGLAYSPDADALDEEAFSLLEGVECWIVDALRPTPHPSHAHLARALEWIARVKPKRAILTNMHVDMDYESLKRELPPGIEPGYDGMRIAFS